jgi:hypothetical protein
MTYDRGRRLQAGNTLCKDITAGEHLNMQEMERVMFGGDRVGVGAAQLQKVPEHKALIILRFSVYKFTMWAI